MKNPKSIIIVFWLLRSIENPNSQQINAKNTQIGLMHKKYTVPPLTMLTYIMCRLVVNLTVHGSMIIQMNIVTF